MNWELTGMSNSALGLPWATRPREGLIEAIPQQKAGLRSDPPDVVAEADRAHARGDRRRFTTRRAPGGVTVFPGIVRGAVEFGHRVDAQPEIGHIGAGQHHRPGATHVFDDRRVSRRHEIF
jgi:hypothetical protein